MRSKVAKNILNRINSKPLLKFKIWLKLELFCLKAIGFKKWIKHYRKNN